MAKTLAMKITIIVLNWNAEKYITACLQSLKHLATRPHRVEIVVVDNASTDDSVKLIKRKFPKLKIIQTGQNLGYAGGNNVGLQYALDQGSDFAWIVNPDVQVHPQALLSLVNAAESHPNGGIFGSKCYFAKGYEFYKERYTPSQLGQVIWYAGGKINWANLINQHIGVNEVDIGQYNQLRETDSVTGASLFVRRQVLDNVGLFDPKYFLYYEETDFCMKAVHCGWKLYYVPESIVWHANAQATGVGSTLVDYYTTRNRLLFGLRWAPWRTKYSLVKESLRLLLTGRPWQKIGVRDFYLGRFEKGSYIK
ncbi:MAG: glycosyltransferase family 2 protein [Patescibacteria group bacterium]|mgnify:CR=1 FL=1